MAAVINLENFGKRLKKLYAHWAEHRDGLYGGSEALAVAAPPLSDGVMQYLKSSSLNIWLLGFEFPDTIMVFAKKQIHFLCSQKKASVLEMVKTSAKDVLELEVVIHVKAKNDDGAALMETIFRALNDASVFGRIVKEVPEGNFVKLWDSKLKASNFQLVDITMGLSGLFAVKDDSEAANLKRAAYLTSLVMNNFVVPKLEQVIDEEKKVSHTSLMEETEKVILQPAKMKVKQLKLNTDEIDICYPPIFQSGGEFDLKPNALSNDSSLYYDSTSVIICAIGARYRNYCANVARSYLFDATQIQKKAYSVLLKAHAAAIAALKHGNMAGLAYKAALGVVEKDAPELAENLTKSAGTGIGLEFRESGYILNGKNDKIVKAGMVFNVSLGFQNLQAETKNPKTEKFSLLLSDTVIVGQKGPEVITSASSKAVKDATYSFQEDEEEEEDDNDKQEEKQKEINKKMMTINSESLPSKVTLRSVKHEDPTARRQHQAELALQKNEETARRLAGGDGATATNLSTLKTNTNVVAYKNVKDIPVAPEKGMKIQIDQKNGTFLLPIDGLMVPFHVSTMKTVTSHQDTNRNCFVRIIFNIPGTPFTTVKFQHAIFVKEVTYRSKDTKHISEVVQQIKALRRNVAAREAERVERATLVNQENLILAGNRFRPVKLYELWIRPVFGGKGRKMSSTLEAHVNGFRYATSRLNEKVDIMYGNIKHAFVQPSENEMITLLHFHLHNHIMVGTKKTKDVQFYIEVMDVVQTVGGGKRSAYDPDELEEEQRERDRKNKTNKDFETFVDGVHNIWRQQGVDLEFDQPLRELGFYGVPFKSQAFIVPTSNCLVELIENPFLVIPLSDIEIVNLERVGLGQKSFDLVIVYKDFKKPVTRIYSVPSSSLDGIEDWLNSSDIKYYESKINLSWPTILKNISDDPQGFLEQGGWEFLNLEGTDSDESEKSEMSDQGYEPSEAESESESEDDDSDNESLVESEDEDEESEESEEEEKGKTWEELEREATNADKEKRHESDSEDERRRMKMKAFGKSRAGPSSGAPKKPKFR